MNLLYILLFAVINIDTAAAHLVYIWQLRGEDIDGTAVKWVDMHVAVVDISQYKLYHTHPEQLLHATS